jgi:hypothetical protein
VDSPGDAGADRLFIRWLIVTALVVLTLGVFAPVRLFDFVSYDDVEYLSGNPNVSGGISMSGLRWAIAHAYDFTGGPVTWLSHMLDFEVFGAKPGPHHLVSLTIHILNVIVLYWLVYRMTADATGSGLVAGLFAVHPLHVESVAWISQRKDVLSTFWWFAAMHTYLSYGARRHVGR